MPSIARPARAVSIETRGRVLTLGVDAAQRVWHLSGSMDPGDEVTFFRNGQEMALNNGGDTVELLNTAGTVVDKGSYGSAPEGMAVTLVRLP